jgi:hypothetical protein
MPRISSVAPVVVGVGQFGHVHAHQGAGRGKLHCLLEHLAHADIEHAAERNVGTATGGIGGQVFVFRRSAPGRRRLFETPRKGQRQRIERGLAPQRLQQLEQAGPGANGRVTQIFIALDRRFQATHGVEVLARGIHRGGLGQGRGQGRTYRGRGRDRLRRRRRSFRDRRRRRRRLRLGLRLEGTGHGEIQIHQIVVVGHYVVAGF